MRRLATALAAAALLLPVPAWSDAGGGASQVVQGTVTAQFGFGVDSAGRISTGATTIPMSVTRERVNGVEIVTIAPRG